jgi:hypothetical protein
MTRITRKTLERIDCLISRSVLSIFITAYKKLKIFFLHSPKGEDMSAQFACLGL